MKILVKEAAEWKEYENFKTLFQEFQSKSFAIKDFNGEFINLIDSKDQEFQISCAVIGLTETDVINIKSEMTDYRNYLRTHVMELEKGGIKLSAIEKGKLKRGFEFLNVPKDIKQTKTTDNKEVSKKNN